MKKQFGFTLMEMLIVLILFSSLLLIAIPMFNHSIQLNEIEQFFERLEKDLYESQMTAMTNEIVVRFVFSNSRRSYIIRHDLTIVKEQAFPKGLQVRKGTLELNNLRFLPSGTISHPGTIVFLYKDEQYVLVFQLGRGRFYFA